MTSEEAELTQLLCESLLVSDSQLSPGGEESALKACARLRHTVDTLLDLLNQANAQVNHRFTDYPNKTNPSFCYLLLQYFIFSMTVNLSLQLEQTRSVHLSLEEKFSQGREDTTQLVEQHKLLMKQLDQEAKLKAQLQLELHKAEGDQ